MKINDNWTAIGGIKYDIDEHRFASGYAGLSYLDECFGMGVNVSRSYNQGSNDEAVTKVMFQLSLRTLGEVNLASRLGSL